MKPKITFTLSSEDAEQLLEELQSLTNYQWNDREMHAKDCGSKVKEIIQMQYDLQNKQ